MAVIGRVLRLKVGVSVVRAVEAVNLNGRLKVDGWLRRIEFALMPAVCLLCGAAAVGRDLCAGCTADLQPNRRCCARCAIPLESSAVLCGLCARRAPPQTSAWVPFIYGAPIDTLLTRLKFGGDLAAGRVLAELALERRASVAAPLPDALVPVPLHASRLRERGYNQALELARAWSRALERPLLTDALLRVRATPAQTGLSALERRRNLRGALQANAALPLPQHVAIVDDVMTTGTTLRESARALRRAGCTTVEVWAVARAPRLGRSDS
jgi:ComF family protein